MAPLDIAPFPTAPGPLGVEEAKTFASPLSLPQGKMEIPPELAPTVHVNRIKNTASKLPSFRLVDRAGPGSDVLTLPVVTMTSSLAGNTHAAAAAAAAAVVAAGSRPPPPPFGHQRNPTFPGPGATPRHSRPHPLHSRSQSVAQASPPRHSKAISSQEPESFDTLPDTSHTDFWVQQQSITLPPTTTTTSSDENTPPITRTKPLRPVENNAPPSRPLIKPIRGFKPSSRKSVDMDGPFSPRRSSMDRDTTVRGLDVDDVAQMDSNHIEQDGQISDDSDLFLRAAREEEDARQTGAAANANLPTRSDSRKSRIGQSVDTTITYPSRARRGSDQEGTTQEIMPLSSPYRSSVRDRPSALDGLSSSRYYTGVSRSTPTTPRAFGSREISPESQPSYSARRQSIPEPNTVMPARNSTYRQSNLSYSTPRNYNSSPLVSRNPEIQDAAETPRAVDGTESTVSTTAPSTVWDELEDLKSRIHRLELTGKLPTTSGAAISRASNERPPTATTTNTTMSTSPKRGRGNSLSPTEAIPAEMPPTETHPLLHSALAKSKAVVSQEVYRALEAAAADALAVSSMMGSSGHPGPISSSQSTIGGASAVSDRQVRRKAESMCRSLTELCLALSEGQIEPLKPLSIPKAERPRSMEVRIDHTNHASRPPISSDFSQLKSSPRALTRLEARRSSLLSNSTLPAPRYQASEAPTPTQTSLAGRRTSLLLRSRRAATEEPEEDDESRFRAPSRATTEIGRFRNPQPREFTSKEPLPEQRSQHQQPPLPSALPVRRHYTSTSLSNSSPLPPVQNLAGRRYLERSTPERDVQSVVSGGAQRRASLALGHGFGLGRTGSLNRRARASGFGESAGREQGGAF